MLCGEKTASKLASGTTPRMSEIERLNSRHRALFIKCVDLLEFIEKDRAVCRDNGFE